MPTRSTDDSGIPLPSPRSCYALQARKTANLLARAYSRAMAGTKLEIAQFSTLCAVADGGAGSVAQIAAHLGIDRSTLVRNLKVLERRRLIVERGRRGRRILYDLTKEGEELLSLALPRWQAMQEAIGQSLADPVAAHQDSADPRRSLSALRKAVRTVEADAIRKEHDS